MPICLQVRTADGAGRAVAMIMMHASAAANRTAPRPLSARDAAVRETTSVPALSGRRHISAKVKEPSEESDDHGRRRYLTLKKARQVNFTRRFRMPLGRRQRRALEMKKAGFASRCRRRHIRVEPDL